MKTLITAVLLTVMGTAGFAETKVDIANKVISKGTFITRIGEWNFIMAYKGKAYNCEPNPIEIHCRENTEHGYKK
jgi:hypothetical protein